MYLEESSGSNGIEGKRAPPNQQFLSASINIFRGRRVLNLDKWINRDGVKNNKDPAVNVLEPQGESVREI